MRQIEKIERMHSLFGKDKSGRMCSECRHFEKGACGNKRVTKCNVYGVSHSEATDWSCRNAACGMIDRDNQYETPVYKWPCFRKIKPKENTQLDGQIGFDL